MSDADAQQQELETLYLEIQERQQKLEKLLRAQGTEAVKEDYVFQGPDGDVSLSALFGDKPDLVLIHNMGRGCAYCTLWADGFNGVVPHLEDRAGFVVVSPNTPDEQQAFADSRGWRFRMVSSVGSTFTADMGFEGEHDGKRMTMPGFSTFRKAEDGTITRIASSFFGPGDPYCGLFHLFALLDGGTGTWHPKLTYGDA